MSGSRRSLIERVPTATDGQSRTLTVSEILGLTVIALVFGYFGGTPGAIVAAVLVSVRTVLSPEYVFAAGQVGLVAVAPEELIAVLGIQAGLALLLVGSFLAIDAGYILLVVWGSLFASIGAIVLLVVVTDTAQIWQVGAVLWVVTAAFAYGLHRHEQIMLGPTLEENDGQY